MKIINFFYSKKNNSNIKGVLPKLDVKCIKYIDSQKRQPFLMFVIAKNDYLFLDAQSQNEKEIFLNKVSENSLLINSLLMMAIVDAINKEVYDGASKIFEWFKEARSKCSTKVQVGVPLIHLCLPYRGMPVYVQHDNADTSSKEDKINILRDLLEVYYGNYGNDDTRFDIIETLTFGMCRVLGSIGLYEEAFSLVNRAMQLRPYSLYLKSANHALRLKVENRIVPDRLMKFIGNDDGYMKKFRCPEPFTRFDIGPNGDVSVCCGHWVNKQIGNFTNDSVESIVNSPDAIKIRNSILDGSYKYCNHLECRPMIQETLPVTTVLPDNLSNDSKKTTNVIEQILFAYDRSCNLSCPSCRTEKVMEKTSEVEAKVMAVTEKLLPIMSGLKILNINPAGELFASKASRRLLHHISDETCPNLQIEIISNGTLFSEDEWNKFPGIHNKVKSVRVSIDAASKHTFEKLRRLAIYEPFIENIQFLSRMRKEGIVPQLQFSFTYQLENFREMPDFVKFGKEMNADLVIFERLQNLGAYSDEEYRRIAVHKYDHVEFAEFTSIINSPLMDQAFVMNDFE